MNKQAAKTIIAIILNLALASASQISIQPSQFNINAFPGETIYTTINLSSDLEYAVNLSYIIYNNQSPINIYLQHPKQLVSPANNISINISLSNDIKPQSFKVKLLATTILPDNQQVTIINGGSESGGGIYYRNITKEVQINNKSLIAEYENKIKDLENNQTIILNNEEENKNSFWFWSLITAIVMLELMIGYYFYGQHIRKLKEAQDDARE